MLRRLYLYYFVAVVVRLLNSSFFRNYFRTLIHPISMHWKDALAIILFLALAINTNGIHKAELVQIPLCRTYLTNITITNR